MEANSYGDFSLVRPETRRQMQATGWRLLDVPSGRKEAVDKALLIDLVLFALDHPPPAVVLLISGDRDFAPALHRLNHLGYTILVAAPVATAKVSDSLLSAAVQVFNWSSLACGLVEFEQRAAHEAAETKSKSSRRVRKNSCCSSAFSKASRGESALLASAAA